MKACSDFVYDEINVKAMNIVGLTRVEFGMCVMLLASNLFRSGHCIVHRTFLLTPQRHTSASVEQQSKRSQSAPYLACLPYNKWVAVSYQ
jgi:hypothetical protein